MESEYEKCTIYTHNGILCEIKCIYGLWSVHGPYTVALVNEAYRYFQQYKADGEYDELLKPKGDI